jgi:alpha-1,2-mannosyltransferase
VSQTPIRPLAGTRRAVSAVPRAPRRFLGLGPAGVVIAVATLLGLALRAYQLARPGHLLGATEYDDGADFGSALRLVAGAIPYRDFITVQPPGITVLMIPAALLSKVASTAWAMGAARILTAAAGVASVLLGGLIVRHRGIVAVTLTCGVLAVYPPAVQSAHTVLLEPWLVLFCLAGVAAIFTGDHLASTGRLVWGGAALGFAGAVKVWAIVPVLVILVLCLPGTRRLLCCLAGVAAGFLVPVLPFALTAPSLFYKSVIVAQLTRSDVRIPLVYRIQEMTGLTTGALPAAVVAAAGIAVAALLAVTLAAAWRVTRRRPPPLDIFAAVTTVLVVGVFLVPDDFYYHYAAFLAPFGAMTLGLSAARLLAAVPGSALAGRLGTARATRLPLTVAAVTGLVMLVLPLALPWAENAPTPVYRTAEVQQIVPPGDCVLTDQASLLIAIDRFSSRAAGCPLMVDATGTDYVLGRGRNGLTAGTVPAAAQVWRQAFGAAQYVWLTPQNYLRIAWTPALYRYFAQHFTLIPETSDPLLLYARNGLHPHLPPARPQP